MNGIKSIQSEFNRYEVGKYGVTKIRHTNHGNAKLTVYRVAFESGDYVHVGLLEHDVERCNK